MPAYQGPALGAWAELSAEGLARRASAASSARVLPDEVGPEVECRVVQSGC